MMSGRSFNQYFLMAVNSKMSEELLPRREFDFTRRNFDRVVKLIRRKAGIFLSDRKSDMVYSRLARRIRKLGFSNFDTYLDFVEEDLPESIHFTNALTTNLTHFFREKHHFEYLSQTFLPSLFEKNQQRIRVWSAGCSTGEEPYSVGLMWMALEAKPAHVDFKILATDLDTNVLEICRKGIYPVEKLSPVSLPHLRWFRETENCGADEREISPKIREFIYFKQLNLMDEWPMKGPLDVIICRNVLIYFDKATQLNLVQRFSNLLAKDGCLILGHSESLSANKGQFVSIGKTIYRNNR